jgi:hypothetical protein
LLGALVDLGVPEAHAGTYAEGVRRGGTLVTVQADDVMADRAVEIMNRHNPVDINERATTWRDSGWTGYDETAGPYEPTYDEMMRRDAGMAGHTEMRGWETGTDDFTTYDETFRRHYQTNLAGTGYSYDYYLPGYQYGYDIARDPRYRGREWEEIEMDVRRDWETRGAPGAWEEFKMSVRHAWEELKDAVS